MKKVLLIILILLTLSGCADYVEINDLVLVSGIILDYIDNNFEVTAQLIVNEEESTTKVLTTKGNSIEECFSKMSKLLNKDLFISQLKTLILTENIITNDIDYYDYFLRNSRIKMNFYVYTISDDIKDEIFKIYGNDASSMYIEKTMEFNNKIISSSTPLRFIDLIYKKYEYGIDAIYPNITLKENNNEKVLYLENLISYKDKNKVILNDQEAIYYNIITNNLDNTIINIPCENESFSITVNKSKTKFNLDKNININTKIKAKLISYECKYNLDKTDNINKLNNLTNNFIKNNINQVINISKENNIDFIGLSNYIYKHDNKNKIKLNNINVNINVNTKINSIGEMRK